MTNGMDSTKAGGIKVIFGDFWPHQVRDFEISNFRGQKSGDGAKLRAGKRKINENSLVQLFFLLFIRYLTKNCPRDSKKEEKNFFLLLQFLLSYLGWLWRLQKFPGAGKSFLLPFWNFSRFSWNDFEIFWNFWKIQKWSEKFKTEAKNSKLKRKIKN